MIKEAYCSFEVAKLLKEKGFIGDGDIGCRCGIYSEDAYEYGHGIKTESGKEVGLVYDDCDNNEVEHNEYLRPTHQMAMAWLREKGIYIYIQPTKYIGGALYGFQAIVEDGRGGKWAKSIHHEEFYDKAVEVACTYSLKNLI